jgi:hypothetical protein
MSWEAGNVEVNSSGGRTRGREADRVFYFLSADFAIVKFLSRFNVFHPWGKSAKSCQVLSVKIFLFSEDPNHFTSIAIPFRRGALAIVTNVGTGCGGRGSFGAQGDRRAGFARERLTARKTNGADAYGKTVWSWHPLLVSSRRRFS